MEETFRKTSQKRVTKVNDFLLKTFKTSTDLNSSLKRQRVLPTNEYLEAGKKSLELLNTMPQQKQKVVRHNKERDAQYLLEAEVKNLEHYKRAEPNEKIAAMIREQKDRRRERHFLLLVDFEKTVEGLYNEIDGEYEAIKEDVTSFYKENDLQIQEYFKQFTPATLLRLDKTCLDDIKTYIASKQEQRGDKIMNLLGKLTDVEHEREKNMINILEDLKFSLIDNAYYLSHQVEELIKEEEVKYEEVINQHKEENEVYVDETNNSQREAFAKFEELAIEVEKKWRRIHHDEALRLFREEMKKEEYTNPAERNEVYDKLKAEQTDVYRKRREVFQQLADVSGENIRKNKFDKLLEGIKELNDLAQATYDKKFEELFALHNSLESQLKSIREDLKDRLEDFAAELEDTTVEQILENEVQQTITEILTRDKAILSEAISCIEENDLKANELMTNLLNFYIQLGTMQDSTIMSLKKARFDYELEKAKLADENDEKLEQLNEQLTEKKKNIREAVHHPKLEEFLQEGFTKLDDVESEFRQFHERNMETVQQHPFAIIEFFSKLEKELAAKFQLVDESKREEIQAKYQKEAEDKVTKLIEEEEERLRLEEEQKLLQAQQDKGGKKPAAKPPAKKDPKKQQKEQEERRALLMSQVEARQVQTYDSPFSTNWLYFVTLQEFTREFFCIKDEEKDKKDAEKNAQAEIKPEEPPKQEEVKPASKQAARDPKAKKDDKKKDAKEEVKQPTPEEIEAARKKEEEEKAKYFVDWRVTAPQDLHGNLLLNEGVFFAFEEVCGLVQTLMYKIFDEYGQKRSDNLEDAETSDKEFIETSMVLLDQRLKAHYPLKGRLETEIYQIRSSEIVEHKKRYERHVRTIIEKLDNQTEEFNLILEDSVESLKTFESEQKDLRTALTTAESISRMDGIQTQAKDKSAKFSENILEVGNQLKMLSVDETNRLLQFNRDYIKNLQLFQNGGNFSDEEVVWYDGMLKDIDDKIKAEAEAREKRLNEIQELLKKKKEQLTKQFEGEYVVALEDLCAKDGTGKKYGKPKRVAQERLRTEMNKCERAQEALNKLLEALEKQYETFKTNADAENDPFFVADPSLSLAVRKNLMALRSCIVRYANHIDAIKKDCPVEAMPRITFLEERLGIALTSKETDEDNKRKEEELELLGPLYYQKDAKKFTEWILDIENNIKLEAQKLYTDKNAKFLTGTDKIPDYLRTYLDGTRRQMEEFRNSSCRTLRESCLKLSELAEKINEMVFGSILKRYLAFSTCQYLNKNDAFDQIARQMESLKEKHVQLLRPNLSNPACREEFENLNKKEKERLQQYIQDIDTYKEALREITQTTGNRFFKSLVNNFEFLIMYYNRLYLFEDFNRLPGDEEIQKKRANLKELLKSKMTGVVIDRTTERCIEKKWAGFAMDSFMMSKGIPLPFEEDELNLPAEGESQQKEKAGAKGKAAPKKEEKKGKDDKGKKPATPDVAIPEAVPKTREVPSFKTFRQKTCYQFRNKMFDEYKKYFDQTVKNISGKFDILKETELKYEFQWEKSIDQIFQKS